MSLFNFLTKTYGYNKPILANEVEYENYPKQQIYKELSELCKAKKIVRLERGVYFIPKKTKFGTLIFNTLTAIEKKYICDNEEVFGYYSGGYMQYQIGLTKVKPKTINIYTNIEKKRSRTVTIAGQRISLRSARTKIDKHNAPVLCFLELMNGIDVETLDEYKRKLISDYIAENCITQKQITKYIPYFPDKACRNLIESEVIYRASRSNSCMVCTYLIELVAGIMTGYIFIYLDDAIVMRFALSMLYIPAVLVLVDAKSKAVHFLVYLILTAVCLWGVFYAIYWRRPFGFSLMFCAIVGFVYYVIFTDTAKKDKMSKILIVNGCFITLVFLIAFSLNLMFNPRHAPLLNGGTVMW